MGRYNGKQASELQVREEKKELLKSGPNSSLIRIH